MAKTTKTSKQDAAKRLADQLKAQQQAKNARGHIIFAAIIGLIVVVVIAIVAYLVLNNPNSEQAKQNQVQSLIEQGEGPKSVWSSDGSIVFSKNGVGDNNVIKNIPTLESYNDFICPGCGGVERQYGDTFASIISSGQANVRFHPLAWFDNTSPQLSSNGKTNGSNYAYSTRAAAAAFYVGEKAPNKYLDFMAAMYKQGNQPDEGDKYSETLGSNQAIAQHIVEAGISQDIAQAAVGLSGNAVTPDWATEFSNSASARAVAGTQAGPYVRYAQAIGQLVSAQRKFGSTPVLFVYKPNGDLFKQFGGDPNGGHPLFTSADELLKTINSAK